MQPKKRLRDEEENEVDVVGDNNTQLAKPAFDHQSGSCRRSLKNSRSLERIIQNEATLSQFL